MASLFKTMTLERITIDEAEALLQLPRTLGVDPADGEEIVADNGRYGPYVQKGKDFRSLDNEEQLLDDHARRGAGDLSPSPRCSAGAASRGGQGAAARVRHRPGERAAGRRQGRPVRRLRHRRRDQRVARQGRPPRGDAARAGLRAAGRPPRAGGREGRPATKKAAPGARRRPRPPRSRRRRSRRPRSRPPRPEAERAESGLGRSADAPTVRSAAARPWHALPLTCGRRWTAAATSPSRGPRAAASRRRPGGWPPRSARCSPGRRAARRIGQLLRAILHDTAPTASSTDRAEALLVAADRAQHLAEVVRPALAAGRTRGQRPQRLLVARLPGLRPRARRSTRCARVNEWAVDGLLARPGRAPRRRPPRSWPRRIGGRELDRFERAGDDFHARVADGLPPAMAAADPERWVVRRRPAGDRGRRRRRPRRGAASGCGARDATRAGRGTRVVGQPTRGRAADRRGRRSPVHAYLFVGPAGLDQGRGRAGLRRRCCSTGGDDPAGRDARLALAGEHPDVREVAAGRRRPSPRSRPTRSSASPSLAPVEGAPQGAHPPRVPPARRRRRGPPAEDDRGAAAVDASSWSWPTTCRPSWSPSPRGACASTSAPIPDDARRRRRSSPRASTPDAAAGVAGAAGGDLDRARLLAADPGFVERRPTPSPASPPGSTAPGHAVVAAVDELLGLIDAAAAPLTERQAAEVAELRAPDRRSSASGAAAASGSRSATSASCAGTAPTSCKAGWPCSPAAYRDRAGRRHGCTDPAGAVGGRARDPRRHRGARAQPERAAAAAGAAAPPAPLCSRWRPAITPVCQVGAPELGR